MKIFLINDYLNKPYVKILGKSKNMVCETFVPLIKAGCKWKYRR